MLRITMLIGTGIF